MNEQTKETGNTSKGPLQKGMILVSAVWIAGLGALSYLTAPSHTTATPVYLPATVETAGAEQVNPSAPVVTNNSVDFIVRFKDVQEVDACLDMFGDDPDGARDLFANWSAGNPTLSGMALKRTSYAGEMILSWSTDDGHRPNRADIIAKQQELQAMPTVKYADPDYTAHAGGTTP